MRMRNGTVASAMRLLVAAAVVVHRNCHGLSIRPVTHRCGYSSGEGCNHEGISRSSASNLGAAVTTMDGSGSAYVTVDSDGDGGSAREDASVKVGVLAECGTPVLKEL